MRRFEIARKGRALALALGVAAGLGWAARRAPTAAAGSVPGDHGEEGSGGQPAQPVHGSGTAEVRFTINAAKTHPISRFIYGVNFYESAPGQTTPAWPKHLTLSRMGGNRLTAYNWENNASNAGSDWHFQNDDYLGGGNVPGEAVRSRVAGALAKGAGTIVTVPMLGFVARDKAGTSVGTDEATRSQRLASRFVVSRPRKGAPFSGDPDTADNFVNQDEFVWWLNRQFPGSAADTVKPIFFSLDNEPDIWHATHEEIRSKVNGRDDLTGYDELVQLTIDYAGAIKDIVPNAQVFGPGMATWNGDVNLYHNHVPDPAGTQLFLEYYLDQLRQAERVRGHRLVDVLDLHWYPAAGTMTGSIDNDYQTQTPEMVNARLQAPRSLWDPTYNEHSWVSKVRGGPIRLIPYLKEVIAAHYPGTKLAITEYYYGRGGDISGGIAQADVLGIFGREGVYAATFWPNAGVWASPYKGDGRKAYAYIAGAFRMYRDYDGHGHGFGNTSVEATTTDIEGTSVYASTDTVDPSRLVIVAINKTSAPRSADIALAAAQPFRTAEVYTMTDASPEPQRKPDVSVGNGNTFTYTMPALSVSTLVLHN
jgi:Glycoside hydrolase family 44